MNNTLESSLDPKAQIVVNYIDKYIEKNSNCYELLVKMLEMPKLENELTDQQWALIIDQAWAMAYRKAMEDSYLSPEEKIELNNINNLATSFANKNKNGHEIQYRLFNSYKNLAATKQKEPDNENIQKVYQKKPARYRHPKPSPYNWNDWN